MKDLSRFTTEELKAEVKRRAQIEKAAKEEARKNAKTCRNCKYLLYTDNYYFTKCSKRTYTIKSRNNLVFNYRVHLSQTCDLFERKEE